jgi:uncharacterized protein YutE (UPF0331/DUF86 family)
LISNPLATVAPRAYGNGSCAKPRFRGNVQLAELLLNKILLCRERIQRLRRKLPQVPASVLSDELLEAFLSFNIFLLIQDASDLANHLVAAQGLGVPTSQRDAFLMLSRAGLIDEPMALEMAAAAGLRNRIAHAYGDVDPVRPVQEAPAGLDTVERFLARVTPAVVAIEP